MASKFTLDVTMLAPGHSGLSMEAMDRQLSRLARRYAIIGVRVATKKRGKRAKRP